MGFSVTIAHGILLIASIVVASVFAIAVIGRTSLLTSIFSQNVNQLSIDLRTDFSLIYAYYDSQEGVFKVFAKNTGQQELSASYLSKSDVYLVGGGRVQLLNYGEGPGTWTYADGNGAPGWQPGETITLLASNSTDLGASVIIKFVLPNGLSKDYYAWLGD